MVLPLASGVFAPVAPSDRPAFWAVTGRLGGMSSAPFAQANLADHVGDCDSAVNHNRKSLAELMGLESNQLAHMSPVHGPQLAIVTSGGKAGEVDSLITTTENVGLLALGADCATIGIHAWGSQMGVAVAAIHCGWKGLCTDVLGATISQLRALGAQKFQAILGPAICGKCYQVDDERVHAVKSSCPKSVASAALEFPGGIDVRAGLVAMMADEGIPSELVGGCTYENVRELYSYRREAVTGRQGLAIRIGGVIS